MLDQVPSDERALLAEALNAAYEEGQEKKQEIQDFENRLQGGEVKSLVWSDYLDNFRVQAIRTGED